MPEFNKDDERTEPPSCLNFPVNVRSLPLNGLACALKTDEKERAALAKAHGLLSVRAFSATFQLRRWKKQGVRLEGQIEAVLEQQCIITAEPLVSALNKRFEAFFVPQNSRLAKPADGRADAELFLDPEGDDVPEVFSGSEINLGAVAEEFFELAIDPYPRKAGASLEEVLAQSSASKNGTAAAESGEAKPISPFAALLPLKKDREE